MNLNDLTHYLTQILQPERFNDYCPNGLQIEGKSEVKKIVTGVTASQALIDVAIQKNADLILVHHGYFWRGESPVITGIKKQRVKSLLNHEISLLAYHLPLDAHQEFGNNVTLGKRLGFESVFWLDNQNMLAATVLKSAMPLAEICKKIELSLGRTPLLIGDSKREVTKVAWCTGAAQSYIEQAIAAKVDVFISGEISEQTFHAARESSTAYIAAGHHATERYGVQVLGEHLSQKFGLEHEYVEIDNPI